jgi:hypothetical protein
MNSSTAIKTVVAAVAQHIAEQKKVYVSRLVTGLWSL